MSDMDERTKKRLEMAAQYIELHKDDSNESLRSRFRTLQAQFLEELNGLTPEQFDFKPSENEWSVREVCLHVAHSIGGVGNMLEVLASGQSIDDKLQPNLMIDDPGETSAVVQGVEQGLQKGLDGYDALDDSPDEGATAEHPFFGPYNCRAWAAFNPMHLSIHLKQVQRVKSNSAFPG